MLTSVRLFNGYAPSQGPRGVTVDLDFTNTGQIERDFFLEETSGFIDFVQSVWVENQVNDNPLTLTFRGSEQRLVVPPLSQGIYPVLAPSHLIFTAETTMAAIVVRCIFLNVPMPFYNVTIL